MAGKPGNLNAVKTGRHSRALVVGKLPKGLTYVTKRLRTLKKRLEATLIACKGSIELTDEVAIQTALRWEIAAAVAQHTLSNAADLTSDQRVSYAQAIAKASAERDKSIRLLKLSAADAAPPWANLAVIDQPATEGTEAHVG